MRPLAGTFLGIELGRRALQAQQRALDTIGQNVANVNTPGYSRQEIRLSATDPLPYPGQSAGGPPFQIGTGVEAKALTRFRDAFLDREFRLESSALGQWNARARVFGQVEAAFVEPSEAGLGQVLGQFWDAVQGLANAPDSFANRATLRQRAIELSNTFRNLNRQLTDLRTNVDQTITSRVLEINALAPQLAALNRQIAQATVSGGTPADLLDRRDTLLDQLSRLVAVRTQESGNGMVDVYLGGIALVQGLESQSISTTVVAGVNQLSWTNFGVPVEVRGGELRGLLDMRDTELPNLLGQLDQLASGVITRFNAVHRSGYGLGTPAAAYTNIDFFSGSSAADIDISSAVRADLNNIAAAKNPPADPSTQPADPGDNQNALALGAIRWETVIGGSTPEDFYRSAVTAFGVSSQEATRLGENQQVLLDSIENQRQSVSGVNLDEELTRMITYQQAYAAAARMVTAVDEMLSTIINRLGVSGR